MSIKFLSGINVDNNVLFVDDVNNRVGVGTGSPAYTLDIATSSSPTVRITRNGAADLRLSASIIGTGALIGTYSNSPMSFLTNSVVQAVITEAGNVGIGTTSPGYKFEVNGTGRFNGELTVAPSSTNGLTVSRSGGYASIYGSNDLVFETDGVFYFGVYTPRLFSVNGSFYTTAGGNVGIGTASPAYQLTLNKNDNNYLQIRSSDTGAAGIYFGRQNDSVRGSIYYDNNADALYFQTNNLTTNTVITSAGNVGIGTTAPGAKLHLSGAGATELRITSTTANTNSLLSFYEDTLASWGIDAGQANGKFFIKDLYNTNTRLTIDASGNVGIGTTAPASKLNVAGGNVTVSAGYGIAWSGDQSRIMTPEDNVSGALIQYGSGAIMRFVNGTTEHVRINGSGNVGIGTTAPGYKLDVNGNARAGGMTLNAFATGTSGGNLELGFDGTHGVVQAYNRTTGWIPLYLSGDDIRFNPQGTERMRITSGGNVGIGTTAPGYKLDVSGDINFSNTLKFGGVNVIHNGSTDVYGNIRVLYSASTLADGMYINYNSAGGGGAHLRFFANSTNERMRIDANSGYVGIGTTSPSDKLHVSGGVLSSYGSTNGYVSLQPGTSTVQGYVEWWKPGPIRIAYMGYNDGVSANNLAINLESSANFIVNGGNVGIGTTSPTIQAGFKQLSISAGVSGDVRGALNIQGARTADSTFASLAFYHKTNYVAGIESSRGGADNSGSLEFYTSNAGTLAERVRVTPAGNVGIGMTTPAQKLHVSGNGLYTGNLDVGHGVSTGDAAINLGTGRTGNGFAYIDLIGDTTYTDYGLRILRNNGGANTTSLIVHRGTGDFSIQNNEAANLVFLTAATERMRITAAGNVGIGTTAPGEKLVVSDNGAAGFEWIPSSGRWYRYNRSTSAYGGIYSEASEFTWSPYGSEAMRINGSGNVGIGTTSPAFKLDVSGTFHSGGDATFNGTNTYINSSYIYVGNNTGDLVSISGNTMYFPGNGNVGIGTTAPAVRLDYGASLNQAFHLYTSGTDYYGINMTQYDSGPYSTNIFSGDGGQIKFRTATGTTTQSTRMTIAADGNVGIGTTNPNEKLQVAGNINAYVNGGIDAGLFASTSAGSTTIALRSNGITHFNGGNVGIGTTAPSEKLHVDGNAVLTYNNSYQGINSVGNKAILARVSPTTGIINYAEYATAANLNGFVMGSDDARVKGNIATDSLEFITNASERMRITSAGNVGIGTSSPSNILHITNVMRMDNVSAYSPNLSLTSTPKFGYGDVSNDRYLAEPVIWLKINVDGTEYVIPGYTEVI